MKRKIRFLLCLVLMLATALPNGFVPRVKAFYDPSNGVDIEYKCDKCGMTVPAQMSSAPHTKDGDIVYRPNVINSCSDSQGSFEYFCDGGSTWDSQYGEQSYSIYRCNTCHLMYRKAYGNSPYGYKNYIDCIVSIVPRGTADSYDRLCQGTIGINGRTYEVDFIAVKYVPERDYSSDSDTKPHEFIYNLLYNSDKSYYICEGCGSITSSSSSGCPINCQDLCDGTFRQNKYRIRYDTDTNGGTGNISPVDVDLNTTVTSDSDALKKTATKTGWEFVGWNTDKDAHAGLTSLKIDSDKGLYAIYKKPVDTAISYIEGTTVKNTQISGAMWNNDTSKSITLPALNSRTGWTGVGWKKTTDKSISDVISPGSHTISDIQTFYGLYKKTAHIGIDANGDGTTDSNTDVTFYDNTATSNGDANATGTLTLPSAPTKAGYTFTGWKINNTGTALSGGTKTTVHIGDTVNAVFSGNPYKVTFHSNNGADTTKVQNFTYGQTTALQGNTFSKVGYRLKGWGESPNTTTVKYTDKAQVSNLTTTSGGNVDLYAIWEEDEYTLTFDANEGSTTEPSRKVIFNNAYGELPTASRVGYTFDGWFTERTGGTQVSESTLMVANDTTVYAHWTPNKYTLTFNANGGTTDTASKQITYDSTYGELPTATKKGHTFLGWFTSENGGTEVKSSDIVNDTDNKTIYAHYEINSYDLSFNTGFDDLSVQARSIVYNEAYGELPSLSKTGYTFNGWYDKSADGTQVYSSTLMSDAPTTIYAYWTINKYTLTFDTNGGTDSYDSREVQYLSTLGDLPTPSRVGYTFDGWFTQQEGGTLVTSDTVMGADDLTIYGHWTINKYKLSYVTNCDTVKESIDVVYDTEIGDLPELSKTGHTLDGWYYGDNKVTSSMKMPANNVTLTAKWLVNKYKLNYTTNCDTPADSKMIDYDTEIGELPQVTKKGYTLDGWYCGETKVSPSTKMPVDGMTIVAKWNINSYKVTLDTNGGNETYAERSYDYNSPYDDLPTPIRTGYTFDGWYTSEEGGSKVDSNTKQDDSNITLYAHWTPNKYTLTFNTNGGNEIAPKQYLYDATYTDLPVPVKKGYTFVGWYDSNDNEITNTTKQIADNLTIYAHWEINKYKLKFNYNGGTKAEAERELKYGDKYGELPVTSYKGYTFQKWVNEDGIEVTKDTVMSDSNVNLIAKWKVNKYKISFDSDGGSAINDIELKFNEPFGTLPRPEKYGYVFDGWFLGDVEVNPKTLMGDSNIKLKARYQITDWYSFETSYDYIIKKKDSDCTLSELEMLIKKYNSLSSFSKKSLSETTRNSIESKLVYYEYLKFKNTYGGILDKPANELTDAELKSLLDAYDKLPANVKGLLTDSEKKKIEEARQYKNFNDFKKEVGGILDKDIEHCTKDELQKIIDAYNKLPNDSKSLLDDNERNKIQEMINYVKYLDFIESNSDVFNNPITSSTLERLNSFIDSYNSLPDEVKHYLSAEESAKVSDIIEFINSLSFSNNNGIGNKGIDSLTEDELKKLLDDYNNLSDKAKEYLSDDVRSVIDEAKDRYSAKVFERENSNPSTIEDMKEILSKYDSLTDSIKKYISDDYKNFIQTLRDKVASHEFVINNPIKDNLDYMKEVISKYDRLTEGVRTYISSSYKDKIEYYRAIIDSETFLSKYEDLIISLSKGDSDTISTEALKDFVAAYDKLGTKAKKEISYGEVDVSSVVAEAYTIIKDREVPLTGKVSKVKKLKITKIKYQKGKKRYRISFKSSLKTKKFIIKLGKKKSKLVRKFYIKKGNKVYKHIKKGKYKGKIKGVKLKGKKFIYIKKSLLKGNKYIQLQGYTLSKKKVKITKSSNKVKIKKA